METVILAVIIFWISVHQYNHEQKEEVLMNKMKELQEIVNSIK